jgi:hypothetical protein
MSTNWLITCAATVIGALAMAPCEPTSMGLRTELGCRFPIPAVAS